MTYEEIIDLFKVDCAILLHKINENNKRFQKAVRESRTKGKRYFKPITFSGSRGFNYVLQFFDYGIDYPTKKRLGLYYYAWFRKNRGIYALSFTKLGGSVWHFTIYHPHFFDRYRDRFLKDPNLSKPEVIFKFVRNNQKKSATNIPSENYPDGYWMACTDGLCLCHNIHNLIIEAKTFITWDMAGVDQREIGIKSQELAIKAGFDLSIPVEDFEEYDLEDNYVGQGSAPSPI